MRITIRDLITSALRNGNVIGVRDVPDNHEANDGLDTLQTLLESLASNKDIVFHSAESVVTSDSNGVVTFGSNTAMIHSPIIKVESIIDIDGMVALQEINKNQFDLLKASNNTSKYYSVDYQNQVIGEIHLRPNVNYSIRYRPAVAQVTFDTVFSDILPLYYWGMIESGLSALLSPKYGVDNSFNLGLFQSRKESVTDIVDVDTLLLNERRVSARSTFNNGNWGL